MQAFLCWLLGHDRMTTSARQRICLRCGTRETLRHYGVILGSRRGGQGRGSRREAVASC